MQRSMVLRERHRAREAELVRQVKDAYYSLAYLDRAIEITRQDESILEHYETLAQARYAQGAGSLQGVVKLQAQITRARPPVAAPAEPAGGCGGRIERIVG